MKFYEALKEVLENGKYIRRPHWEKYLTIGRGTPYLMEYRGLVPIGGSYQIVSQADLVAQDWEIVKEKVKKTRTVWINCYKDNTGMVHSTPESAAETRKMSDFLFTKEVTFEWEEEAE